MNIDVSKLRGKYVYLELLLPDDRDIIRELARDERIWEFNKMLLIDDNYDKMYDGYFDTALDKRIMGGQHSFVIRGYYIPVRPRYIVSSSDKLRIRQ